MPKERRTCQPRPSPYPSKTPSKLPPPPKTPPSTRITKELDEVRCPICLDHPHNAVLLSCKSTTKGCHPYICDTSHRYSNCLDQFKKMSEHMCSQTGNLAYSCPLCRGEVTEVIVPNAAREYMNEKVRTCSKEECPFSGTYKELRKHVWKEHPMDCPTEPDPSWSLSNFTNGWCRFDWAIGSMENGTMRFEPVSNYLPSALLLQSSFPPQNAKAQMRRRRTATRKSTKTHQNTSEENESEPVIPLLISTISQTIEFLSSNDLLLSPSSTLTLSSLISRSSHSLASLLTSLKIDPTLLLPHSKIPNQPSTAQFPFFRRLLSFPDPSLFFSNFHVSKPTFYLLLQTLTPSLSSLSSSPFPPDLKLAAFLFRLAHSAPFSFISHRFFSSSSSSLSCRIFYEVCRSVIQSLHNLLHLSSDISRVVQGFQWMSLPRCCGILSFFRIPVSGELRGGTVLGQFVVDSEGRFLDLSVGWHGCMKPEMIIPKTKLYALRESVSKKGEGYFIGGSYCPLKTWLLTPYKGHSLSKEEDMYNVVHGRGMEIAEKAARRLRGRWKLLRMEWREECVEALPYVAVVACLLHNYLIMCNETEVVEEEKDGLGLELGFQDFGGKEDVKGVRARDLLASQMSQVMMTC